ncbi:lysozyme inhibitor LprI family protein [Mailhella massiliensis]|uniref:DUF1311 domain-containing protein n=1 Tax=Mailhella massiliensis TaxID=1903261 RepID=A0A921AX46_9BACT|nr:lysozyme inhibitor LprI family protein [Mailhella massiliensis]HJD97531.1 DUF1311 domain-containing protein [Mailhella massiliensis]
MKTMPVMLLSGLLLTVVHGAALAEEELAPGYNICMENALSNMDMMDCTQAAYEHWDKVLNENYAVALKACDDAVDPAACRANIKKAERLWVQYKEAMAEAVADLNGGGSLSRLAAESFLAEETKKQATLLGAAGL